MIHLCLHSWTVVILILLHTLNRSLLFLLKRLSVLCSYWHLSSWAYAVNTDNSLHLKQWSSLHLLTLIFLCRHFMWGLNTVRVLQCLLTWSGTVVCADIKPSGAGWIANASSRWMVLSSVQSSHCAHEFSLWDKPIHVVIAFTVTSQWASVSKTGSGFVKRRLEWVNWLLSFRPFYRKKTCLLERVAAWFSFHLNSTLSFHVRPYLTFKYSHLTLLRFGCRCERKGVLNFFAQLANVCSVLFFWGGSLACTLFSLQPY